MDSHTDVAALQQQVQRGLGRFLLRMQQYERLLRALLVGARITGTVASAAADQDTRLAHLQRKSLGHLLNELFSALLHPTADSETVPAEWKADTPAVDDPESITFRMRMGFELREEDLGRIRQDLQALLQVRNHLVHHLIEAFDVWTPDGCKAAQREVDAAYRRVDEAFHLLRRWAESLTTARQQLATLVDSVEFASMMTTVGSPPSPLPPEKLVALLRDAETLAGPDGWTELDRAIDAIRRIEPEHAPHRYGRRAWHQVLEMTGAFELRRIRGSVAMPGRRMYRSLRRTPKAGAGERAPHSPSPS